MEKLNDILKNARILVADSNKEDLDKVDSIFSEFTPEIIKRDTVKNFIGIVKDEYPDIILINLTNNKSESFALCKKLKSNEDVKDIPVLFIAEDPTFDEIKRGLQSGGVDYVTKPFQKMELIERVSTHIELSRSRNELKKLVAEKNKFISMIAHDIKSPLSGIKSLLTTAKNEFENLEKEDIKEIIDNLYDAVNSQYDFIIDILDWGRLQMDRIELHKDNFDISDLAKNCLDIFKVNAGNKNIELNLSNSVDSKVYADPSLINKALQNLISNAIKFTDKNGEISIDFSTNGNEIVTEIKDNGRGIPEEVRSKLFQPDKVRTTEGTQGETGTGLGLLLVKEMIEKNDGELWFESEEGKGTSFFISLPKAKSE